MKIKVVLSGSGLLYPVQVGALLRLVESGYQISEICGTSGGAIVAAAIASGYPINIELVRLIKKTLPVKTKSIKPSLLNLFFKWGLIKTGPIEALFDKFLVKKFHECKIPLSVVTTNVNRHKLRVFSTKVSPDMSISKAVAASMAIPGVFNPIEIDGELYVDGGVMANYYLDIFGSGDDVVGLRFKSKADLDGPIPIGNKVEYLDRIIDCLIQGSTNEHIDDAVWARTIVLSSKTKTLDFNINEGDVDRMIDEGYRAADEWLKTRA